MGYPDDDTFAEAHGWNKDRPSYNELLKQTRENSDPPKETESLESKYGLKIVSVPIFNTIIDELQRATVKFPTWPTDPLHALAVLGEEYGELTKEMLQMVYEPHKSSKEKVRLEAIQCAAMALRLAMSLDTYQYTRGPQHKQRPIA